MHGLDLNCHSVQMTAPPLSIPGIDQTVSYFPDGISRPLFPALVFPRRPCFSCIFRGGGGVLNFGLGTDVRPDVSTTTL